MNFKIGQMGQMRKFMLIFNYLSFQICWVALTVYDNIGLLIFFMFLNIHFILIYYLDKGPAIKLELITLLIVCLIGTTVDLLLTDYKVYNFLGLELLPHWYMALWVLFASTLNHCFYSFLHLPAIVVSFLAALFVPLAYTGLTVLTPKFSIAEPQTLSLLAICTLWFLLLPLFTKVTLLLRTAILNEQ